MYPLVVLTALALGMFVLSRVREKLEPTETIREPVDLRGGMEQAKPEIERVWNLLDDTTKNAFVTFIQSNRSKIPGASEEDPTEIAKTIAYNFVYAGFYGSVYRGSATPITESQIDQYIQSMIGFMEPRSGSEEPPFINLFKDGTIKRGIMMIYLPTASSRSMTDTRRVTPTTTPSPMGGSTTDSLNDQYNEQMTAYNNLIDESIKNPASITTNLEKIKKLNVDISRTLDQMIALSTRTDTMQRMETTRDELVNKLQRIQRDYDGLLVNTDKLETLRRIRQFEEKDWKREVLIYLIVFLVLALVLLIIMFVRRQKKDTAIMTPMTPASIAPLT